MLINTKPEFHLNSRNPKLQTKSPQGFFFYWCAHNPRVTDPKMLSRLRTEGRRVNVARIGDAIYELDGQLYRYFLIPEGQQEPGEGPWRAEPYTPE